MNIGFEKKKEEILKRLKDLEEVLSKALLGDARVSDETLSQINKISFNGVPRIEVREPERGKELPDAEMVPATTMSKVIDGQMRILECLYMSVISDTEAPGEDAICKEINRLVSNGLQIHGYLVKMGQVQIVDGRFVTFSFFFAHKKNCSEDVAFDDKCLRALSPYLVMGGQYGPEVK